jgi:REP element-mobilizing transposase RayT
MPFYRRHLPHWIPDNTTLFVSWRLKGSLPGKFSGPTWLLDDRVAQIVAEAILHGDSVRYRLHAWVIMPNNVHAVFDPLMELPAIMHWLKGRTARKANRMLGRSGMTFWQDESFDHWIRPGEEFDRTMRYVENNPVRAGLVEKASDWEWSSARKGRPQKTMACPTHRTDFTD